MFDHNHYVPIMKWRQGEYLALERSKATIKDWLTPLFEIPLETWDFENEAPSKSLDEHLEKVGKKLKKAWGARRCFFDSPHIDGDEKVGKKHHLVHVFDLLRNEACNGIPVAGFDRSNAYLDAVRDVHKKDRKGVALRLFPDDFSSTLPAQINATLSHVGAKRDETDIVIDSGDDVAQSATSQARTWHSFVLALPHLQSWRTLTVAGGSFPASLSPAANFRPHGEIKRREWRAYKKLIAMDGIDRRPTFGDYVASSPKTALLDPRLIDPNAKIKYTLDEVWRVYIGQQVKRFGRSQYKGLCETLVNDSPKVFDGPSYSHGDMTIADCAAGGSTGGPGTWPQAASSHHIAKSVRLLANLFGASSTP